MQQQSVEESTRHPFQSPNQIDDRHDVKLEDSQRLDSIAHLLRPPSAGTLFRDIIYKLRFTAMPTFEGASNMSLPVKVAITGGGIAGCSLANGLISYPNIQFDVFEGKSSLRGNTPRPRNSCRSVDVGQNAVRLSKSLQMHREPSEQWASMLPPFLRAPEP